MSATTTNGTAPKSSMNDANERDPFNNNSYGTLVDQGYKMVSLPVLDVLDFNERVIRGYEEGWGERDLPADLSVARSLIPAGTATLRNFSNISPEIPVYITENCTGCMDCVTECPDTAILGKVLSETELEEKMKSIPEVDRAMYREQWSKTKKYYDAGKKKTGVGGMFQIIIDPSKCKGCAECVTVCDDDALKMVAKTDDIMTQNRKSHRYFKNIGPSNDKYISDSLLIDMMLKEQTHLYVGGAGSCAGCGEGTALRMLCSATGSKFGDQWALVAATGCNTVYTSTYPYNPYLVPWTNSLFENAPADAIGVRMRWDQMGWQGKPIWCIGGDGAMFDIGFQALSRLLASGMNIKVFVLDTQVYSNTGGQASTSTFTGQNTKMSVHGKTFGGKQERRKEIAQIAMMHPQDLRRADDLCPHQPLLQVGPGRSGIRRPGACRLLHDLPTRARRGRQHGWRASSPGRGQPGVSAVDIRSTQRRNYQDPALAAGQSRRQGRLVQEPQDQRGSELHRFRPQRGPFLQALRQGRQSVGIAPVGQAGTAGKLAPTAGIGWTSVSHIMAAAIATHDFSQGGVLAALEFLKRMCSELRTLRKVRIWKDHFHIIDVNKDYFEVRGIGYGDADIVPLLRNINTAFDPQKIHEPTTLDYKEFDTGRRHPWAEDRVM